MAGRHAGRQDWCVDPPERRGDEAWARDRGQPRALRTRAAHEPSERTAMTPVSHPGEADAARVGEPLPDPRSGPEKDAALVQRMFDRVAPRYDLANAVLSLGQDRHWRRVAARAAEVVPGEVALDVATGTGMLADDLAEAGAQVIALDFSEPMLRVGAARMARAGRSDHRWVAGDGTRLPLPDDSVDAVTIAFGLRNLPDVDAGLAEMARVTRPGGRLVVLEFGQPPHRAIRTAYHAALRGFVPAAARVVASDPRAYSYLAESIVAWPDAAQLAARLGAAGWERPRWKHLALGAVTLHQGRRAPTEDQGRRAPTEDQGRRAPTGQGRLGPEGDGPGTEGAS